MYLLYLFGIPYIYYTLTRYRTPAGHGLNWTEPSAYKLTLPFRDSTYTVSGAPFNKISRDLEYHPDDRLRTTVSAEAHPGELYHVPMDHRSKGVAGECC